MKMVHLFYHIWKSQQTSTRDHADEIWDSNHILITRSPLRPDLWFVLKYDLNLWSKSHFYKIQIFYHQPQNFYFEIHRFYIKIHEKVVESNSKLVKVAYQWMWDENPLQQLPFRVANGVKLAKSRNSQLLPSCRFCDCELLFANANHRSQMRSVPPCIDVAMRCFPSYLRKTPSSQMLPKLHICKAACPDQSSQLRLKDHKWDIPPVCKCDLFFAFSKSSVPTHFRICEPDIAAARLAIAKEFS